MASVKSADVVPAPSESCIQELTEADFLNETQEFLPPKPKRFAVCSEKEIEDIENLKDEINTKRQTVWGVKILKGELRTSIIITARLESVNVVL